MALSRDRKRAAGAGPRGGQWAQRAGRGDAAVLQRDTRQAAQPRECAQPVSGEGGKFHATRVLAQ